MNEMREFWSLLRLSEALRRGELTVVEVAQGMLERIIRLDGTYRSYTTVTTDRALSRAEQADREIQSGRWRGPLHGVPIAVKDLCFTRDAPTSAGMAIYKDWIAPYDATVVRRLEDSGAIMLGKLTMTEGATLVHHSSIPAPRNPWNGAYWTGISSSGSGVATAAGLCFGSLGSDTGGSIRFPSSCCGITGIKPTWGRVSRHGVFPLASSLDHVGPMARSAADAAAILAVIAGEDPEDATSLDAPVPDYLSGLTGNIRGIRIGVDPEYSGYDVDEEVARALADAERALSSLGAQIRRIHFPSTLELGAVMPAMGVEIAEAHRATFPARAVEYGPFLAQSIEDGWKVAPLELAAALRARREFCGRMSRLWRDIDLLLVPVMPGVVPAAAEMEALDSGRAALGRLTRFTVPFNLTGNPTITLPCGFSGDGLPIGLQLVGAHLSEALLCRTGHAFQQATDWHARHPTI